MTKVSYSRVLATQGNTLGNNASINQLYTLCKQGKTILTPLLPQLLAIFFY